MLNLLQLLSLQMETLPENMSQSCETNSADGCLWQLTFMGCALGLPAHFALSRQRRTVDLDISPIFLLKLLNAYTERKLTGTAMCLSVAAMILWLHTCY
jgi:hypothetical protein